MLEKIDHPDKGPDDTRPSKRPLFISHPNIGRNRRPAVDRRRTDRSNEPKKTFILKTHFFAVKSESWIHRSHFSCYFLSTP